MSSGVHGGDECLVDERCDGMGRGGRCIPATLTLASHADGLLQAGPAWYHWIPGRSSACLVALATSLDSQCGISNMCLHDCM